jgi:multidrug efflux pump subunit AcrB
MISDFFIRRPVLANVLAILMMVVGVVALFGLPVAQYPDVVPPTVQVTTPIRAPAPAPSSMQSPCRSSNRSTASRA